jgi:hypothetical protein
MSVTTAEIVLNVITALGCAVWIAALQFLIRIMHTRRAVPPDSEQDPAAPPRHWSVGTVAVEGDAETLMRKAISGLVKPGALGASLVGTVKITERTQDTIVFEQGGAEDSWFRQGRLLFAPAGNNRTRIDYALELPSSAWLLLLAWTFQAVGLIALPLGYWLVYTYFVTSLNPQLRFQTFQMAQTIHFLWPPFLFAGLYRQRRNAVLGSIGTLLHNLPYLE